MAGGALSPRQKMINLMYLIFIAMLALNMSKEVLQAFGLMNDRLEDNNHATDLRNTAFLEDLKIKASDQPEKFSALKSQADQINVLATDLDSFIEDLKKGAISEEERLENGQLNGELMDKGDYFDDLLFTGDKLTKQGQEFINKVNAFRDGIANTLDPEKFKGIIDEVMHKFDTGEVTDSEGVKREYLEYHYFGFPEIASIAKMSGLQNDIKATELEVLSAMLQGQLSTEVSFNNYTTLMETGKSAYFNGEQFDGQIVLGRKDNSTKPSRVELTLDGRKLSENQYTIEEGRVKLKVGTGNVGEHKIEGNLFFAEGGEEIEVPVSSTFATVAKPNAATISADKMNVVYRGVKNPMTISFAGVSDNNVTANGEGLSNVKGSQYIMDVTRVKGREVTINVTGKLPDGAAPARDSRVFRIKDLPRPTGTVRGEPGATKMQRNGLEISTVAAKFEDFDFDLPLKVTGFLFKVQGQPAVKVRGNKLDAAAKRALRKAKRGSTVQIRDIEAKAQGVSIKLKKVSPVFIELTN